MINYFKEIKELLDNFQVVERYLGTPYKQTRKGLWYKSPFRDEKTASFYVSEKGIHDFGSSEHYDIIGFVAKYFNTDTYKALKILCNDFGLTLLNKKQDKRTIRLLKAKREQERKQRELEKRKHYQEMRELCNELLEIEELIRIFEKTSYFETLKILYDKQSTLETIFEQEYIR